MSELRKVDSITVQCLCGCGALTEMAFMGMLEARICGDNFELLPAPEVGGFVSMALRLLVRFRKPKKAGLVIVRFRNGSRTVGPPGPFIAPTKGAVISFSCPGWKWET